MLSGINVRRLKWLLRTIKIQARKLK
ncbi:Protein of unknown function [Lactobacillus helveticus CIRM-BIA 953]|uniref:Uncharacterized protein n=1 Tax=Lactobacillus helveticus CIRM-BIA 953 TaxID=1226335 RepID=U4QIR4_LACHE|nr:Protein of unknown function [Lactobacillus helveticus CIRM-BIA 953]CDI43388.1 Protein of unknown function [Lactobacillus helveticus CIRM-BIA 953]